MEAFAGLSRKAAGSQGRALSRTPQSPKSPFDSGQCRNQPKNNKKARPQTRNSLERPSKGTVFPFWLVLIETRGGHRVSKGEFRTLRSPTQGSALRTRKPFEKGLTENFN